MELFRVLDTPVSERADLYLDDETAAFPYVNGGLFSDENNYTEKIDEMNRILTQMEQQGGSI